MTAGHAIATRIPQCRQAIVCSALLAGLAQGCMTARVTFPDGTTAALTRPAFLAGKSALTSFEASATNGAKIVIRGYRREDSETTAGLVQAAVAGAVQGIKTAN